VIAALIAAAPYAETPLMVSVLVIEAVLVGIAARRGKSVILAGAIAGTIAAVTLLLITAFVLDDYIRRRDALQEDMAPVAVTTRERELLQLVAEGRSNKEAAATLGISVKTIAAHRANIMRKLHLRSVSDLVRYAIRNKIVQP
jgi:DNA-binding NarL/FixJ family response regulator